MKKISITVLLVVFALIGAKVQAYPLDGSPYSMIRRLVRLQLIEQEVTKGSKLLPGQLKSFADIKLNLLGKRGDSLSTLPEPDPEFQKALNRILYGNYSLTVVDMTPGRPLRYASRKETVGYQPGSVGKLAVAAGFFTELKKIIPGDDYQDRANLLCSKMVRAGDWALPNQHTVPFYNPETREFKKRTLVADDVFTLFEWLDHMVSVSSNGAASVVWREAVLMRVFGVDYPGLTEEEAEAYFKETPKDSLRPLAMDVVNAPLRDLGITKNEWRLGSFFTRGAKARIPGLGGSIGTPLGLMKFMVALERGKVVDSSSSLEIKRLMYSTDRRIRYAKSTILNDAAVYFKSGSLYKCEEEEGYECKKYKGNVYNYMNSIAIVERGDSTRYMVALMSNVLKLNSGYNHRLLAGRIDKIIRQ